MMDTCFDSSALTAFVCRQVGHPARELALDVRPLRGGLESPAVARIGARFLDEQGRPRLLSFVVKLLEGAPAREAEIYRTLVSSAARDFSPAFLGIERLEKNRCLLFLEPVRPVRRWPWRDPETAARVLERLAHLHTAAVAAEDVPFWDYEAELAASAKSTLETLEDLPRTGELRPLRRSLPSLRRVVAALPEMRRRLLDFAPLPPAVIHGDVHSGNALMRLRSSQEVPVLLDWGRARIGSPLEDVSSWLQSLGFYEPQARRRHDTLLVRYLTARGLPPRLDRELRNVYWMAAASNALAGALNYHLWSGKEAPPGSAARAASWDAARDSLRVLRRADACMERPSTDEAPAVRGSLLLPERLRRLDLQTPPGGSERGQEAHGHHEQRDGGQEDGPSAVHDLASREVFEQGRHPEPQGDSDRELDRRAGKDAPQDAVRVGSESGPDPDLPPTLGDGK